MLNFRGVKFLMGIILIPQTFKKHVVFRVFFSEKSPSEDGRKNPGLFRKDELSNEKKTVESV